MFARTFAYLIAACLTLLPVCLQETRLHRKCKRFFLSEKPAPNLKSTFDDRARFQIGTMSHVLNNEVVGWEALPEFPAVAPDPTVRDVEVRQGVTMYDKECTDPGGVTGEVRRA